MEKSDAKRTSYTYHEVSEEHLVDGGGRPKEFHTEQKDILYLGERRYEHLLSKDGKPLEGASAKREEQRIERAVAEAAKLSEAQRADLRAKAERERHQNNEYWKYIPAAYIITQVQDQIVGGRPAYVLSLRPKPGYNGKYASMLSKIKARLFVDKQNNMMTRVEAEFTEDVSVGFVFARISKGTHLSYELARINDEVWLPKEFDLQGSARFLFKSFRGEQKATFSGYRKYESDSRIVATSVQ